MQFYQLEYFLAVAKYLSFTKAALEINVSQSSLSVQINKLEKELGVRLFVRLPRSIILTAPGKEFLPYAERILEESINSKTIVQQYISLDKGNISIGAFNGSQYFGFIDLVSKYIKAYPNISYQIHQDECFEMLSMLINFEIDVAFLTECHEEENILFYPLHHDHVVAIVNRDHHLAGRKTVSIDEIANEPLICLHNTTIHQDTVNAFKKIGMSPNIALLFNGPLPSILAMVASGIGLTMVSSRVTKYYEHLGLKPLHIEPFIPRTTYIAVSEANMKRPIISNFVQFILDEVDEDIVNP